MTSEVPFYSDVLGCHLHTGKLRTIASKKFACFTLVPVYSSFSSLKKLQTALKVSYAFSCQILAYILLLTTLQTRTPSQTVFQVIPCHLEERKHMLPAEVVYEGPPSVGISLK